MAISPVADNQAAIQAVPEQIDKSEAVRGNTNDAAASRQQAGYDRVEISEEGRALAAGMKGGIPADSPVEMEASESADHEAEQGPKHNKAGDEAKQGDKSKQGDGAGAFAPKEQQSVTPEVDKEETVDELKDTESDLRKKKDELQEVKTTFFGSEEDQARKIKEIKKDIDDLTDTKDELESKLSQ